MSKIKGSEVTIGQTIKGNMMKGFHQVAEIRTGAVNMRSGVATTISLHDADGQEIWIGRTYAKVVLPA